MVILGAGDLGGTLARQLAAADIASRVVIVDALGAVAEGKALDILQAAPVDGYSTLVAGTTDDTVVTNADVVVLADRAAPPGAASTEWRDEAGAALVRRVAYLNTRGMILCAGAHQMDVVARSVREGGLPRARVIGSAPEALRAATVSMVALEAACAPTDVGLAIVGRPPVEIIVSWDDVSIAGRRATEVLSAPAITRLDARLPRLWPPGPYALASAATRLLSTAARRTHHTVTAFVHVAGGDDASGRVGMWPVHVSPAGVSNVLSPTLSARNRVRLESALT